jgi:hypothetical protein
MANILLSLIFVILGLIAGALWVFLSRLHTLDKEFREFLTQQGENQPSPLAVMTQAFCDTAARSISASLKATFMGKQSGDVRALKALAGDVAEDTLAGNPIAGAILNSFPAVRKNLRKHPELLDVAMSMINKTGSPGSNGGKPGDASSPFVIK